MRQSINKVQPRGSISDDVEGVELEVQQSNDRSLSRPSHVPPHGLWADVLHILHNPMYCLKHSLGYETFAETVAGLMVMRLED